MIRLWGKIITNNHIVKSSTVLCDEAIDYQKQLTKCLIELCYDFDIEKPYWLPKNLKEYNSRKKTSFNKDNFTEQIDFDKFEIEVVEEK